MKELQVFQVQGHNIFDIVEKPDNYPEELLAAAIDVIRKMSTQIYEAKLRLEGHVIELMKKDNATKLEYKGIDGDKHSLKLRKGAVECKLKDADDVISVAGFDPILFGEYVYKPKWGLAKEQAKNGGKVKELVDKLFVEGKESLIIE